MKLRLLGPANIPNPKYHPRDREYVEALGYEYAVPAIIRVAAGHEHEPTGKRQRREVAQLVASGLAEPTDDEAFKACGIDPADEEAKQAFLANIHGLGDPLARLRSGNATGNPADDRGGRLAGYSLEQVREIAAEEGVDVTSARLRTDVVGLLLAAGVDPDRDPPESDGDDDE